MFDGGRVIGVTFLVLALGAVPAWVASAWGASDSVLARPVGDGPCLQSAAVMRRRHPGLLGDWRDWVVRGGAHSVPMADGREVTVSLAKTCLGCHGSAEGFCDRCHTDVGVELTCWVCHAKTVDRGE